MFWVTLLFLLFSCGHTQALKGYNCTAPNLKTYMFSLLEPKPCPNYMTTYKESFEKTVQIFHRDLDIEVNGFNCHVTVTREVIILFILHLAFELVKLPLDM